MENNIKNNLGDITYKSELIPPFWQGRKRIYPVKAKRAGLIRPFNLHSLRSVN